MQKISLAIPTYNSSNFIMESFRHVINDERIEEIIFNDDGSTDFELLKEKLESVNSPKIKIFRNEKNIKAFENKAITVSRCSCEWVILLDSDNVISKRYLDKLYQLEWKENTIYCPSFARPLLDFRGLGGVRVIQQNAAGLLKISAFATFMNDGNYFFHRYSYLHAFERMPKDEYLSILDVFYYNSYWLKQGNCIDIVKGLSYFHRFRKDSFFSINRDKSSGIALKIKELLTEQPQKPSKKKNIFQTVSYKIWAVKNLIVYTIYENFSPLRK